MYLASTVEFLANEAGEVRALRVAETEYLDGRRVPKSGTEREIPADLVLLALGFTGPERDDARRAARRAVQRPRQRRARRRLRDQRPGVFVAGDAGRGQSLIVWAIAEGRAAAAPSTRSSRARPRCPSRSARPIAPSRSRPRRLATAPAAFPTIHPAKPSEHTRMRRAKIVATLGPGNLELREQSARSSTPASTSPG